MAIAFTYDESTNIVAVTGGTSGTPATFADFVTADRAGTAELTSEDAPASCAFNMTLTEQIRPVEDLALQISFILAGTSAGTTQEWTAASVNVTANAIIAGSVTDTYTDNGTHLQIDESVGAAPCLDFDFTWSGLPTNYYPEKVTLNGYYDGNPAHDVFIYMWNYDTTAWDRLTADAQDFPDAAADDDYEFDVPTVDTENYFDSGAAKVRINHTSNGTAGHDFYVDQILLTRPATNNTLDITGTDWDGNAQSESIDVSGGDDTYNGAYKWRTITDIDCNGWPDGTLKVTQPQWGVIWDYGNGQYNVTATNIEFGNGTTSTYFTSEREKVQLLGFLIKNSATVRLGAKYGDYGIDGSWWNCRFAANSIVIASGQTTATFLVYDSYLTKDNNIYAQFQDGVIDFLNSTITAYYWDTAAWQRNWAFAGATSLSFNEVYINNQINFFCYVAPDLMRNVHIHRMGGGTEFRGSGISVTGITLTERGGYDAKTSAADSEVTFIDSVSAIAFVLHNQASSWVKSVYTCNITVADKDGTLLDGVEVLCEDEADATVWTTTTGDTDTGKIDEQQITYRQFTTTAYPATITTYSPHKFTLSKAGYETLILENVTVDVPIVWHLELQDPVVAGISAKIKHVGIGV